MITPAQHDEIAKYELIYKTSERYKMGDARRSYAQELLRIAKDRCESYMDVGCGRGEMVRYARSLGYQASGLEAVDYLADDPDIQLGVAWDTGACDRAFDLVGMWDVIEHILPQDCDRTLRELARIAKKEIFLTAANYHSKASGVELHVNRLPYDEWDRLLRNVYAGWQVTWLPRKFSIMSETWHLRRS